MEPAEVAEQLGIPPDQIDRLLDEARLALLATRATRVRPARDTKILAGWNGLAIRALAEGGRILHRPDFLAAAERAARFVLEALRPDGRLVRSYRDGPSEIPAFLEDFAFLIEALITLYESTFELWYLERAEELAAEMISRCWDQAAGSFFDTGADTNLIVRPRSLFDNPIPAGSSAAAFALLRLSALSGGERYGDLALAPIHAGRELLSRAPLAFSYLLSALDFYLAPPTQIAIVPVPGDDGAALWGHVFASYLPNRVLAVGTGDRPELLANRRSVGDRATAYVCRQFACRLPVTSVAGLIEQLEVGPEP